MKKNNSSNYQRLGLRSLEHLTAYYLIPVFIVAGIIPRAPLVYLAVIGLSMYFILLRKYKLDFRSEWGNLKASLTSSFKRTLLIRVTACLVVCLIWIVFLEPSRFLEFPKKAPRMWLMVLCLYPIFSVLPQEIIYRTFYFKRYSTLFSTTNVAILTNGFAFAASHLIFYSWFGVILSLIGGIFLADTYKKTNCLSAVWLEHSLYGWIIFTIGLGKHFYAPEFG